MGDDFKGWFLHSHTENGYYIDIYRFWIEQFNPHIHLTAENLFYGIFHHCLDKDKLESLGGKVDITKLRTISLYCENAPTFKRMGKLTDSDQRNLESIEIHKEIRNLPDYLGMLNSVIKGEMSPQDAELSSGGVLSAKIL
jgi:hypothetical protein